MTPKSLELILKGIAQSRQLLVLADAGEWEQFLELEQERHAKLVDLKLEPVGPSAEEYAEIRSRMNELVDLNNQIEQICIEQRADLVKKLKQFNQNNKAHKAYSSGQ